MDRCGALPCAPAHDLIPGFSHPQSQRGVATALHWIALLLNALDRLDRELEPLGVRAEIFVVGGAAMAIAYDRPAPSLVALNEWAQWQATDHL